MQAAYCEECKHVNYSYDCILSIVIIVLFLQRKPVAQIQEGEKYGTLLLNGIIRSERIWALLLSLHFSLTVIAGIKESKTV